MFPDMSVLGYASGLRERRVHYRRAMDEDAQLAIPGEYLTLTCRVVNLSEGGAGIKCDVVPHAGTKVTLAMKDGRVFEGVTAWYEGGQLGLRFVTAVADSE